MKDEFRPLPDEIQMLQGELPEIKSEYNEGNNLKQTDSSEKRDKFRNRKKRTLIKYIMSRTVAVSCVSVVFANTASNMNDGHISSESDNNSNSGWHFSDVLISIGENADSSEQENSQAEEEYEPVYVTCDECNGTGIYCRPDPNFGLDRGNANGYPGCGGTGTSKCPDWNCNNGIYTCPECSGSGRLSNGMTCEICSGRGVYPHEEFCMGTGIIVCMNIDSHVECAKCEGTGKMVQW